MTTPRWVAGAVGIAVLAGGLAACEDEDRNPTAQPPSSSQASSPQSGTSEPASPQSASTTGTAADEDDLDAAESKPRQDPVYSRVGNPVVDALHYDLTLDWSGSSGTLTGTEELTFRVAKDSPTVVLDMSGALRVTSARLDGQDVKATQRGSDLVLQAPVLEDEQHVLSVTYEGSPRPAPAPTTRTDFTLLGWQFDPQDGTSYTMQEPYGAFTWYAVNDQPSDKAYYDITVTTPQDLTGVANGTLESNRTVNGKRTTRWHLDSPASSYLVTVATGRYTQLEATSKSGVPLQVWAPPDNEELNDRLVRQLTRAVDWDEEHLGPLPFDSLGLVVVNMNSAMETQTMLTLGNNDYTLSTPVIAHESIHQWYGDTVTPRDWRDVWMNEGMTMYLQWCFEADSSPHGITTIGSIVEESARNIEPLVRQGGPPADYDPSGFGLSNIYVVPAIMWHRLRVALGDKKFWSLVRKWPQEHRWTNADYDEITSWWSDRTGLKLKPYFDSWLLEGRPVPVP